MADVMSVELPIQMTGRPGIPLEFLEKSREYKHVAKDALSRGLQKPPIITDAKYAEDISADVDINLSGMMDPSVVTAGLKNADRYESETPAQAYRRLWLEVMNDVPNAAEQMVFEYSGITFDPRLGRIVTEDQDNLFSQRSSDLSGAMAKSFQAFHKERRLDPSFNPVELFSKEFSKSLKHGKMAADVSESIFTAIYEMAQMLPRGRSTAFIKEALKYAKNVSSGASTMIQFQQRLEDLFRQASQFAGERASQYPT